MAVIEDPRARILQAATGLIESDGLSAVTTRAVAAAAGVQPTAIYRLFDDMQGLLDAVAVHGFAQYLQGKPVPPLDGDPVEALRAGWDAHVQFGMQHASIYRLMYVPTTTGLISAAAKVAFDKLLTITRGIARAGRLTVDTFTAADMMHSGAMGVTFTMLNTAPDQRDSDLPRRMRELIIGSISDGHAVPDPVSSSHLASALNEHVDDVLSTLTPGERGLIKELLTRLARETPNSDA